MCDLCDFQFLEADIFNNMENEREKNQYTWPWAFGVLSCAVRSNSEIARPLSLSTESKLEMIISCGPVYFISIKAKWESPPPLAQKQSKI